MKHLVTVAWIALLATPTAYAQIESPSDATRPVLVEEPSRPPVHRGVRLGIELAGGSLSALAGGFGGFLLVCGITANPQGTSGCGPPAAYGASLGAAVGLWAGVMVTGYLLDGNGSMLWTFVGESLGLGAGLLTETALSSAGYLNLALVTLIVLPVAGALIGYEGSSVLSRHRQQHALHPSEDPARLVATVLMSGRGTPLFGLAGAF